LSFVKRVSVLIADDHPLMSQGLKALLRKEFEVTGIVNDGREVVDAVGGRRGAA